MRLTVLSLALAIAASAPLAAEGQAPVQAPPLRAGEVLLEVNALGMVESRADRATLSFGINGSGETEAQARASAEASISEVRSALRGLGVADADVSVGEVSASASTAMTMDMALENATVAADEAMMDTNMVMDSTSASARAQAQVVIRNVDRVTAVQQALIERGIYDATPAYALADESVPRRQARAQALAKARADAEAYAAALNMRIVRVVRVTERLGLEMMSLLASEMQMLGRLFAPNMMQSGPRVQTMVVTGVDFALAPR